MRAKRDGGHFLKLALGDRTGQLTAMIWDGVEQLRELCQAGRPVHVCGRYEVHPRWGAQLALRSLLDRVLGPHTKSWERYRRAPAAKLYHQAYLHGLLEHCLTVAQGVALLAGTFPGIDRDVAVTGALLHDIGKLEAYTTDPIAIDLTDAGRLQGEIPLGYYRVRRTIEELPGFPRETAQAVLHIILSHHGALAHGSPVVPCTREAWLVHMIDNLGGKLGSFDRLQKELPPGTPWAGVDRGIGPKP